jgi:hypothetical protein
MAEGKKVGSIYIDLGLKTSTLESGLKKGESSVRGWTSKIGAFFTGAFVVAAGMAMVKFVALVGNAMKKAAGLVKNLFVSALKETSEDKVQLKRLANEMGSLKGASKIIDDLEKKSVKWGVATDDVIEGYTVLRRFFDEKFIQNNLEDIASASKQLRIPISELGNMIAGLSEGMLSARRLLAMGVSKEELSKYGIKFGDPAAAENQLQSEKALYDLEQKRIAMRLETDPIKKRNAETEISFMERELALKIATGDEDEKILSSAKEVSEAIMKIYKTKYTEGAGAGIATLPEMITRIRNLWDDFLGEVGKAGVYDLVVNKLQGIVAWVQNNSEQIKKWATDISKFFSDTFAGLSAVLEKVFGVSFNAPSIQPNKGKSYEELGKMLGFDEQQINLAASWIQGQFRDEFKKTAEGQAIEIDAKKMLDLHNLTEGGGGATPLTPFWEKIVSEVESGTFKTRLSTALTSVISNLGSNEALLNAAGNTGAAIAGAIIKGIVTAIGDWEIRFAKEHPILGFGMGGGLGAFAGESLNNYADYLGKDNLR